MPTLAVLDANAQIRYLDMLGVGSDLDPFQPRQQMIEELADAFYTLQVLITTAGQIVQLPNFTLKRGVLLKALSSNQGSIFLGGSAVSASSGFELDKSQSILIRIDELSKLYITSDTNNEGICLIGL